MRVGSVIIGRNEGDRLRRCLESVVGRGHPFVYVDSGSSDGSAAMVRSLGAVVVELDLYVPFTAARARNAGFARLLELMPGIKYVQFLDGDCEVVAGWIEWGTVELETRPDAVAVCGRVLERRPEGSVYNRLCALEWQKPVGEIAACGGIFMVRAEAFRRVGGFREDVIAAEDDELCLRLRRDGGKILSTDADMVWHDAAMTQFGQWWKRAKRAGHAYAQGASLHGGPPERHFVRQCRSTWFWGLVVPLLAILPAWWTYGASMLLFLGYPLLAARIYQSGRRRGWSRDDARIYAVFTVIAKWPQLLGILQHHRNQWRGRKPTLIEYKGAETAA